MKLILIALFCIPAISFARDPGDAELRRSIKDQLIKEEKECTDCAKMRPEVLEREVNRIFASEKNKKRQEKEATQQ